MSEDPQPFFLSAIVYGSAPGDGVDACQSGPPRRVEVQFQIRVPDAISNSPARDVNDWVKMYTLTIQEDLKHSHDWRCAFCDKPAREQFPAYKSSTELPLKMDTYIYLVCDNDAPCGKQAHEAIKELEPPVLSRPPGYTYLYPQAASCMKCKSEDSAQRESMRCSGCKLTRAACQKDDWKRHKKVCKETKEVKWTWV